MNIRVLRWVIVGLLAIGAVAFIAVGANSPKDPSLAPASGQASGNRTRFGDFAEIGFHIEGGTAAAATAARCALLAETAAQQGLGLMNRTDLGGYDGMLFKFTSDSNAQFYMLDTPLPLSIAFFDASGAYVSQADMPPCGHQSNCPTYAAARPYRWALEVPQGGLPRLAIGPGSRLVAAGACT